MSHHRLIKITQISPLCRVILFLEILGSNLCLYNIYPEDFRGLSQSSLVNVACSPVK